MKIRARGGECRAAARSFSPVEQLKAEEIPGAFSQHDFGQVDVRWLDGTKQRIHVFASTAANYQDRICQPGGNPLEQHFKESHNASLHCDDSVRIQHDVVRCRFA
jgi:hypothetical protein